MLDKDKDVQGVAVYAEFAKDGATTQVVIAPDGYDNEGTLVPATIVRRTVTTTTPKKQWKFTSLVSVTHNAEMPRGEYVEGRMKYATVLFDQLLRGDWKLIKSPILVEVSKKDYDSLRHYKTPTKMLYRISQSRSALDFPAELVNNSF